MQINHWLLPSICLVSIAFILIRARVIWLNLRAYDRAYDFVSKEIRAAEEAARSQCSNVEVFYTKNLDAGISFKQYDLLYIAISFFHSRRYLDRWINYDAHKEAIIVYPEEQSPEI